MYIINPGEKGSQYLPGFLCSSLDTYDQYIRIGYGGCWDKTTERAIKTIGDIIKRMVNQNNKE